MRLTGWVGGLLLLGILLWSLPTPTTAEPDPVARGRYLAERVGVCADCHTPRLPSGEPDRSRWMMGAEVDFKPVHDQPWATHAPALAGMVGLQEQEVVHLLMTGTTSGGIALRPPMPRYRLDREDAEAVVAYLKSLKH